MLVLLLVVLATYAIDARQAAGSPKPGTQVVMLGTGTPRPDPDRSGPATAVVVNGKAYIVDIGPGIVRRAQAAFDKGITALAVANLTTAFITHLHSDHTVGYPDLIFTPWVMGRKERLTVYGPPGTEAMTHHIMEAWRVDIDVRSKGLEQRDPAGVSVAAHDIKAGVVYQDANVKVTAFPTPHGELQSFGYRFDTPDRSVVISGDTSPGAALMQACHGCDVLIHEAFPENFSPADMPNWANYRPRYHTTSTQLGEIAAKAQPKLLVVYHRGIGAKGREIPDEQYLSDIRRAFRGKVALARDLDVY